MSGLLSWAFTKCIFVLQAPVHGKKFALVFELFLCGLKRMTIPAEDHAFICRNGTKATTRHVVAPTWWPRAYYIQWWTGSMISCSSCSCGVWSFSQNRPLATVNHWLYSAENILQGTYHFSNCVACYLNSLSFLGIFKDIRCTADFVKRDAV